MLALSIVAPALDAGELGGAAPRCPPRCRRLWGGRTWRRRTPGAPRRARTARRWAALCAPLSPPRPARYWRRCASTAVANTSSFLQSKYRARFAWPLSTFTAPVDAGLREHAVFHVGGKPRHHLVVDEAFELLAAARLAAVVARLVHDEADGVRSEVYHSVVAHGSSCPTGAFRARAGASASVPPGCEARAVQLRGAPRQAAGRDLVLHRVHSRQTSPFRKAPNTIAEKILPGPDEAAACGMRARRRRRGLPNLVAARLCDMMAGHPR